MTAPEGAPELPLKHLHSGKVREMYEFDEGHLAFVTSDRISAFDVIMNEPVPNKGRVLNGMTSFWFNQTVDLVTNHRAAVNYSDIQTELMHSYYQGRTEIVKKVNMLPIECIVRGYLTGSALAEYQENGTVHGMPVPAGMVESQAFREPIFTPSTKAQIGYHDENISFEDAVVLLGDRQLAHKLRDVSLHIFDLQSRRAAESGIVMADTKYEFGELSDGTLVLCDEVGTPDSSRFWPADKVELGKSVPSYDKQYVRDYLKSTGWDKTPPPPPLPSDVVANTARKYQQAYELITGLRLADWPGIHVEIPGIA